MGRTDPSEALNLNNSFAENGYLFGYRFSVFCFKSYQLETKLAIPFKKFYKKFLD